MGYVGNDIVDMRDPANRGKSRDVRFQEKVFHREERKFIHSAADPDGVLWMLWAVKEAAWKAAVKAAMEEERRGWKGIRIRTDGDGLYSGKEAIDRRMPPEEGESHDTPGEMAWIGIAETFAGPVSFDVRRRGDCIHAVSLLGPTGPAGCMVCRVKKKPDRVSASRFVRNSLIGHLAATMNLEDGAAEIRRDRGPGGLLPPRLLIRGKPSDIDISLSHDGGFTAWAMLAAPRLPAVRVGESSGSQPSFASR